MIIVNAFSKGLPIINIDPSIIIFENDYDNNTNHVSSDKLIPDEWTAITNRAIETVFISNNYPIKLFVKPFYDGYIVYQHGICGYAWHIDNEYQL